MTRWIGIIFIVCCVATVLSEAMGVALLWSRGQLTSQTLSEIRDVLAGTATDDDTQDPSERTAKQPDLDLVANARAMRVLEFNTRQAELRMLTQSLAEARASLLEQRQEFDLARTAFQQELQNQQQQLLAESVEQGRAILTKLSPEEAVGYLMNSDTDSNVLLLKGMSEKVIAKILDEFAQPDGGIDRVARGREIFEAIYNGAPTTGVINTAAERLSTDDAPTATQTQ